MRLFLWLAAFVAVYPRPAMTIVAPRNAAPLPLVYLSDRARTHPGLRLSGAWIEKARDTRSRREVYLSTNGPQAALPSAYQVAGEFRAPVLLGTFSNQANPYPFTNLQTQLFDGPWPTGTVSDYFAEVSYGALNVTGTVRQWVPVSRSDSYYEGTSNGLSPGNARTGEFIKELLDATDAAVDFRLFDNDGPDGAPNSGDDDGFVDLAVFVHSDSGGECGGADIWSHTGDYRLWPISGGTAYATNDPGANGGFIQVKDYAIQAGKGCGGGMIEIGGFCHAIGHAFGLPDLFDEDGGTNGIGEWGLMGRGNWNTPESPAHLTAWARAQLGWVVPTDVGPVAAVRSIPQIATSPVAFKLAFSDDRFRRATECAISGTHSLRCALDTIEAAARGWSGASGYGNGWVEVVERDFHFDGDTPVTFSYAYRYDLEANYDSAFVSIVAGGTQTTLAAFNGTGSGTDTLDLTPFLAGPGAYRLRFTVTTDGFGSDEDGRYLSTCGAFAVDDVTVSGGGESYASGFENSVDGWFQDPASNPPGEYWLVENRQPVGFDAHLANSGLLIWHVDEEVMGSLLGNTGGGNDTSARGLVLEEADGIGHLLQNPGNAGDAGDPFPGSTGNTRFDAGSSPASTGNTGLSTVIEVSAIGPSGPVMSATMRAGDPAPTALGLVPSVLNNDLDTVTVEINGDGLRNGATFGLQLSGEPDIIPIDVRWHSGSRLEGDIKIFSRKGGSWHLLVTNPDGQQSLAADALTVGQIVAARLVSASISVHDTGVELRFGIFGKEAEETLVVSRAPHAVGPWQRLPGEPQPVAEGLYRYLDPDPPPGRMHHYRLEARSGDGVVRELYRGSAVVPALKLLLEQNHPNPFNPSTTLSYVLPEDIHVSLDIFNISGMHVRTVVNARETAGPHHHLWDGRDSRGNRVGSGLYFYRLKAGRTTLSRKMLLLK